MVVHEGHQHIESEYGSIPNQDWLDLRHAKITGTRLGELLGTPAAKKKLIEEIAWSINRTPPIAEEQRQTADMKRGNDLEPFCIAAIEDMFPITHKEIMFIELTDTAGLSPDFVDIDLTVGFEIKCLQAKAASEVIYSNEIPKKHLQQVLGYFQIPTMKSVTYTIFVPAMDMANGEDFLHMITLYRKDHLEEIANMTMSLLSADLEIKKLRE